MPAVPVNISSYVKSIESNLRRGDATEHTHRPALKALIEEVAKGLTATNEPKRIDCGAPDFIITRGQIPLGYIEAKDVGTGLDAEEKKGQMKRYLASLGNLLLTDYLEFRWYVQGEYRQTVRIGRPRSDGRIQVDPKGEAGLGYPITGSDEIVKVRYVEPKPTKENELATSGRIYINKEQFFNGIDPELWEFHIGGYQVLEKWLKDRKGRKLSWDDIQHYQKIAVALLETKRIMAEIDSLIPSWPIQ